MSADTLEPAFLKEHVARAKAAWHARGRAKTWEEKVAAIERMRERDKVLRAAREAKG